MKLFIKNISSFIVVMILLSILLDYFISWKLKKVNKSLGEHEVWNDIYGGDIEAEIAIYGSSRAWVHFNSEIIESTLNKSTYNFGVDGHNFWIQHFRHSEYFKFNEHPKTIFISVDPFTLAKRKELYNYAQFLPYMLWNESIYDNTKSYEGFNKSDYFAPLIRYSGELYFNDFIQIEDSLIRHKGFRGMEYEWTGDLEKAKENSENISIQLDANSVDLFNKFIREMKSNRIDLVFIYTPEYKEGQSYIKNRGQIISMYLDLSKKYDIPFFNYSDSSISQRKELFYNSLHLNSKGADIFTTKFVADYVKWESEVFK